MDTSQEVNNPSFNNQSKIEVVFADDFTVTGKIQKVILYQDQIQFIGPKLAAFQKKQKHIFQRTIPITCAENFKKDSNVPITVTIQRHLGAVISSINYNYCQQIANYSAYVSGFKSSLSYLL